MKLSQIEWKPVGKAVIGEYNKDDVAGMAAEMAYHFIFAIFPFFIFLATVATLIGRAIGIDELFEDIVAALYSALPPQTAEALREPLEQVVRRPSDQALSIGAVVGILLTLYSASNGIGTVMKAFNRAYGVEETRSFIKKKALSVGLTLVLSFLLIFGFVSLTFGHDIGEFVAQQLGLGGTFEFIWNVLRIVLALVGISLALALLYWQGPNVDQQFRWISPGSVITTIALALFTLGFALYVNLIGGSSYARTYGTIFGLILFMFYLYLASQVILLGAEFNAETAKRYDPDTIRDKITDPRKQLPGKQPAPHPQAAAEAGVSQEEVLASNERSLGKLAAGGGSPATATLAQRAGGNGTPGTVDVPPETEGSNGKASTNGQPAAATGIVVAPPKAQPSRTGLATLAISGAAIAGAVALGALQKQDKSS